MVGFSFHACWGVCFVHSFRGRKPECKAKLAELSGQVFSLQYHATEEAYRVSDFPRAGAGA